MLLNFKCNNFRSFRDETNFTMIPSNKRMHKEFLIEKDSNLYSKIKALPVTIIYGANASGKTNIILGIKFLKTIVLSGSVDDKKIMNLLETLPFIHDNFFYKPIEIEVIFYLNKSIYKYGIVIGKVDGKGEILKEYLFIDENEIFNRDKGIISMPIEKLKKMGYVDENPLKYYETLIESINKNQEKKQLFLSNGLKVTFNKSIYNDIVEWFNKFNIIMDINEIKFNIKDEDKENMIFITKSGDKKRFEIENINQVLELSEFGNQGINFISNNENDEVDMVSNYKIPSKNNDSSTDISMLINSENMESKGTIQLLKLVQPFVNTLKNGGIIALDEMDASLHFEIVVSLIRVFNNQSINKNGAQLIFNTHNPIYLDGDLLRHDQITMVKKDPNSLISELYSLSDYGLRPEEKLLKNYLNGKYGALPHMDLEIAFKKILDKCEVLGGE